MRDGRSTRIERDAAPEVREHMSWVRTRMQLDAEMMESVRHGSSLIAAGFGSFAFLQGVIGAAGEAGRFTTPSRGFSLVVNAAGILLIVLASNHNRQMTAWINADEFPGREALKLPQENLPFLVATLAVIVGIVAFVALLIVGDGPAA